MGEKKIFIKNTVVLFLSVIFFVSVSFYLLIFLQEKKNDNLYLHGQYLNSFLLIRYLVWGVCFFCSFGILYKVLWKGVQVSKIRRVIFIFLTLVLIGFYGILLLDNFLPMSSSAPIINPEIKIELSNGNQILLSEVDPGLGAIIAYVPKSRMYFYHEGDFFGRRLLEFTPYCKKDDFVGGLLGFISFPLQLYGKIVGSGHKKMATTMDDWPSAELHDAEGCYPYVLSKEQLVLFGGDKTISFSLEDHSLACQKTNVPGVYIFCNQPTKVNGFENRKIIAHRGASYWAPEHTMLAYYKAILLGAHYLEVDLQRTKDGYLVSFHDDNLKRTTNVKDVFPDKAEEPLSSFTLAELKKLDAGSWFNEKYPERARTEHVGLKIVTLEEIINLLNQTKKSVGLYIETKEPKYFPGIEGQLKKILKKHKWLNKKIRPSFAEMPALILQTFEKKSLELLSQEFPDTPKVLLLWVGEGAMKDASVQTLQEWLSYAKKYAQGVGVSYEQLRQKEIVDLAKEQGLFVHYYTVNDEAMLIQLLNWGADGIFTDRAELLKNLIW